MEIGFGHGPLPHADYDIALDTLRPLRLFSRQFSCGNAIGPVRKQRQRFWPELAKCQSHVCSRLACLYPACPCLQRIARGGPFLLKRTHTLGAERVARLARILHGIDPVMLCLHHFPNTVAVHTGTWKFAFRGNLKQRVPVNAWIVFGRGGGAWCLHGGEIELPSDFRLHFR